MVKKKHSSTDHLQPRTTNTSNWCQTTYQLKCILQGLWCHHHVVNFKPIQFVKCKHLEQLHKIQQLTNIEKHQAKWEFLFNTFVCKIQGILLQEWFLTRMEHSPNALTDAHIPRNIEGFFSPDAIVLSIIPVSSWLTLASRLWSTSRAYHWLEWWRFRQRMAWLDRQMQYPATKKLLHNPLGWARLYTQSFFAVGENFLECLPFYTASFCWLEGVFCNGLYRYNDKQDRK